MNSKVIPVANLSKMALDSFDSKKETLVSKYYTDIVTAAQQGKFTYEIVMKEDHMGNILPEEWSASQAIEKLFPGIRCFYDHSLPKYNRYILEWYPESTEFSEVLKPKAIYPLRKVGTKLRWHSTESRDRRTAVSVESGILQVYPNKRFFADENLWRDSLPKTGEITVEPYVTACERNFQANLLKPITAVSDIEKLYILQTRFNVGKSSNTISVVLIDGFRLEIRAVVFNGSHRILIDGWHVESLSHAVPFNDFWRNEIGKIYVVLTSEGEEYSLSHFF